MSSRQLQVSTTIEQRKQQVQYDQSRRSFFSTLFDEVKSTNKLAVKEWLASDKIRTYQDKMKEDPVLRLKKNGKTSQMTWSKKSPMKLPIRI
jgi:hypothetical protein